MSDPLVEVIQAAQDANSKAPGPPYETEAESIARAVRDHTAAVLTAEYVRWCEANDYKTVGVSAFYQRLCDLLGTEDRPTVDDLLGSQPDITGGLDSVEFVRKQRDRG